MRWLRDDNIVYLLAGLVIFETSMLITVAKQLREKSKDADVMSDLARYYADLLNRNDVEMEEYDVIALHAIVESRGHKFDE